MTTKTTPMLRTAKELQKCSLRAEDGLIGSVRDLYFDDVHWTVRYLVVDTGGWLDRHPVLISPEALGTPEWDEPVLTVHLTREQVRNSPDIDTAKPVSRQHETELRGYYGWPIYWGSMYAPLYVPPLAANPPAREKTPTGDPHLHSTKEIIGDRLEAADGEIGHVDDVLVDDETWTIRYLVIDTLNWWPGRKVVISPQWVNAIDWAESKIRSDITRVLVKGSPTYDPQHPLDTAYADRLHDHYGKPRHVSPELTRKS